ncbi:hypothetical protein GCM10023176_31470 [Micromonospora coerulea]|uniref:Uncharacterized protein n=1 Tax=Micromonospora coerulea TaxID=47856 RepID=A0ABP8SN26_9ACTN
MKKLLSLWMCRQKIIRAAIHRSPVRESRRAAADGVLRIVAGALVIIVLRAAGRQGPVSPRRQGRWRIVAGRQLTWEGGGSGSTPGLDSCRVPADPSQLPGRTADQPVPSVGSGEWRATLGLHPVPRYRLTVWV